MYEATGTERLTNIEVWLETGAQILTVNHHVVL